MITKILAWTGRLQRVRLNFLVQSVLPAAVGVFLLSIGWKCGGGGANLPLEQLCYLVHYIFTSTCGKSRQKVSVRAIWPAGKRRGISGAVAKLGHWDLGRISFLYSLLLFSFFSLFILYFYNLSFTFTLSFFTSIVFSLDFLLIYTSILSSFLS